MRSGMDVARLNFSHGSFKEHLHRIHLVRKLDRKNGYKVKMLGDLEGYRMRVGRLKGAKPIELVKGEIVRITNENILGKGDLIPFDFDGPLGRIAKGKHIYIDDGNIALISEGPEKGRLKAKVLIPGAVKERKGINIPSLRIDFVGLTEQDKEDIDFCAEHKVEYIAQSFVRTKDDMLAIREYLKKGSYKPRLIAKIENWEGIRNIDGIIKVSDGIMVARGDMGVSIPIYEVPLIQKEIIRKCNRSGKFVITATQMLESMTENHRPTRAEVSDVANAILDGTNYVMLSGETSVGAYPSECVDMMEKIIRFTEKNGKRKEF
jgi:pyruvate kinase